MGGGYVGLEVAAVAVKSGLKVTVLEAAATGAGARDRAARLGVLRAGPPGSRRRLARRGPGERVRARSGGQAVTRVHCADGELVEADLVIVGIGLLPNTELAAAAGLAVDDGILVDACSSTSVPTIVAAGDCTRFHSVLYGRSIRLESVPNALEQARSAAAALVGARAPVRQRAVVLVRPVRPEAEDGRTVPRPRPVRLARLAGEAILRGLLSEGQTRDWRSTPSTGCPNSCWPSAWSPSRSRSIRTSWRTNRFRSRASLPSA